MSASSLNDEDVAQLIGPTFVTLGVRNRTAGNDATLSSMANIAPTPNDRSYTWFVANRTVGGLNAAYLQLFSYGSAAPGAVQCISIAPNGICAINRSVLDSARIGSFTGTGSAATVSVTSINAGSTVLCSLVGTTNTGGFAAYIAAVPAPTIVIIAGTGFIATATNGLIYQYEVIA